MNSHGPAVAAWIEGMLVHGEGDYYGQPFRLRDWQRKLLDRLYELDAAGDRKVKRALIGLPKGNGKTELLAAIGMAELCGPYAPDSPNIPVAAASFDQADLVFGAMKIMAREGPLAPYLEVFDHRIHRKASPGRAYRVAAQAGTNDGLRPTCFIADEVHEWVDRKERVHLVLSNSLAKRRNALELNISTAGWDRDSLLGRLYDYGQKTLSGEIDDPGFLFEWWQAPDNCPLSTEADLVEAIRVCNPAVDDFWPIDNLLRRFREIPEFEFRRYHLNQWTVTAAQWLPSEAWGARTAQIDVPDGSEIVVGFDGSYNRDSTALIGCTLDGHLFVIGVWENPGDPEWRVDRAMIETVVGETFNRYRVLEFAADPYRWQRELEEWGETYGDVIVEYPTNSRPRIVPACARFYAAVLEGDLTHDGNPILARHLMNARVKETVDGAYITKEHRDSPRKIDAAIAAIVAYDTLAHFTDNEIDLGVMVV